MAKKSNNTVVKEEKNTQVVCCMDCLWANLHQYGTNPILAGCRKQPNPDNERFPFKVMVASARWICPDWKKDPNEKSIEKREKAA